MNSVMELLQKLDLSPLAQKLLGVVDATDPCFMALVFGVLVLLGSKMVTPYPQLRSWGARLAVIAALGYFGWAYCTQPIEGDKLPAVVFRAVIAAELVLMPMWVVMPILAFLYLRLRLLLAAFLGYFAYVVFLAQTSLLGDDWPMHLLRGCLVAGLAGVVAWILQPFTDHLARLLPARPASPPEPRPQRTELVQAVPVMAPPPPEPQRVIVTVDRLENTSRTESEDQRRRHRARLKAELCYTLHEPQIGDAFPRMLFTDFLDRYLGDQLSAAAVEENARELENIIFQHTGRMQPAVVQPASLKDLTEWLLDEQKRIESQEADAARKNTKLAGLTRRYTQLAEQFITHEPPSQAAS